MSDDFEELQPSSGFQALLRHAETLRKAMKFQKLLMVLQAAIAVSFVISPANWFNVLGFSLFALASLGRVKELKREADRLEALPVRWGKGERQEALVYEGLLGGPMPRDRPELDWEEREEVEVEYGKLLLAKQLTEGLVRTYKDSRAMSLGWLWVLAGLVVSFSGGMKNGFAAFDWFLLAAGIAGSLVIIGIYQVRGRVLNKRVDFISDKIIHLEIAESKEGLAVAREDANKTWEFTRDKKNFFDAVPK